MYVLELLVLFLVKAFSAEVMSTSLLMMLNCVILAISSRVAAWCNSTWVLFHLRRSNRPITRAATGCILFSKFSFRSGCLEAVLRLSLCYTSSHGFLFDSSIFTLARAVPWSPKFRTELSLLAGLAQLSSGAVLQAKSMSRSGWTNKSVWHAWTETYVVLWSGPPSDWMIKIDIFTVVLSSEDAEIELCRRGWMAGKPCPWQWH